MVKNELLFFIDLLLIFNLNFIAVYCQYDLIHMLLICANTRDTFCNARFQSFILFSPRKKFPIISAC